MEYEDAKRILGALRDLEWEELDVDGVVIRTATPAMLYRMKRDTVRPQDRLDAAELKRRYGLEEP